MEDDRTVASRPTPETQAGGSPYHILAASSPTDERTRVLKHGETFAVFDHYGDIRPGGLGEEGLYHEGTRYLSCLVLEMEGGRPFFLSSTVRDENDQLAVALTNPDLLRPGQVRVALGTLHLALKKVPLAGSLLPGIPDQEPRSRTGPDQPHAPFRRRLRGHLRGPRAEAERPGERPAPGSRRPACAARLPGAGRSRSPYSAAVRAETDPTHCLLRRVGPVAPTAAASSFFVTVACLPVEAEGRKPSGQPEPEGWRPSASAEVEAVGRQPSGQPEPEGWRPSASAEVEAVGRQPSGQPEPEGWRPSASAEVEAVGRQPSGQPEPEGLRPSASLLPEKRGGSVTLAGFEDARAEAQADLERSSAWSCHVRTSNGQINAWVNRAVSDLHMLTTELPTGPYPYAGVPWFNTPFGRDGIITALECLWLRPGLARGVLAYLAATQATEFIPEQDAEPGKILHETRSGEMADPEGNALRPLLRQRRCHAAVRPAGGCLLRAHRRPGVRGIALAEHRGRASLDRSLRRPGRRRLRRVSAAVGRWAGPPGLEGLATTPSSTPTARRPVAPSPCVRSRATSTRPGGPRRSWPPSWDTPSARRELTHQAESLRVRFEEAFWCEELSTYALALDGDKRPCRVRTSNAGQCLFTGIASPDRARRVARTLLAPESFSGWGVRTVAASESRYNPMGYHTGAVWPHDNALIARGLARYGLGEQGAAALDGPVRGRAVLRPAPDAGAVLRLRPGAGRGAGPLSGGLRSAGLVGGFGVPAAPGLPGPGDQRTRGAGLLHPAPFAGLAG